MEIKITNLNLINERKQLDLLWQSLAMKQWNFAREKIKTLQTVWPTETGIYNLSDDLKGS